jgi:hypothetical protein
LEGTENISAVFELTSDNLASVATIVPDSTVFLFDFYILVFCLNWNLTEWSSEQFALVSCAFTDFAILDIAVVATIEPLSTFLKNAILLFSDSSFLLSTVSSFVLIAELFGASSEFTI